MKCKRLFIILVTILVLVNIGLVYLHFFSSGHHHRENSQHSWLARSLDLTEEQSTQHVRMRKQYFDDLRVINDSIQQIKARFIAFTAQQDLNDSLSDLWTDSINRWHRRADERTFNYVRALRQILRPNQQGPFDSLFRLTIIRRHRDDDDH